jgi:Leucine-rich repeat (LRR) protein
MTLSVQNEHINLVMEQARETGKLDLSNLNLLAIPPETFDITNLVELDLSHNAIPCVPSTINRLTALRSLKLDGNRLTELPRFSTSSSLGETQTLTSTLCTNIRELGEMGWLEELSLTLNSDLAPEQKRKMREGLPILLDYLRCGSSGFKSVRCKY